MTQNNGNYAVQGHSRSSISVKSCRQVLHVNNGNYLLLYTVSLSTLQELPLLNAL